MVTLVDRPSVSARTSIFRAAQRDVEEHHDGEPAHRCHGGADAEPAGHFRVRSAVLALPHDAIEWVRAKKSTPWTCMAQRSSVL
jgi:hypothetical protein